MGRRKLVAFGAAAVIGVTGAYWWWSPALALRTMRSAAVTGDGETFNEHVDYPRLRESVKGQVSVMFAKAMSPRAGESDAASIGSALGAMLGMAMVDKMVEAMVSPEFVMRAIQEGRMKAATRTSPASTPSTAEDSKVAWISERRGANKYILYGGQVGEPKEKLLGLVLERSGFANWKLTEVRMPLTE